MDNWKIVRGSQLDKPAELDSSSSKFFVYLRKNIQRVSETNEFGETCEFWQYEELKLTKEAYAALRAAELEEQLTQTQLALTEIYESLVVNNG